MRSIVGVLFGFFIIFRPHLYEDYLSLILLPFLAGCVAIFIKPRSFLSSVYVFRVSWFLFSFLVTWALVIDLTIGGLGTHGFKSEVLTLCRFFIYFIAVWFWSEILAPDYYEFKKQILIVIFLQIFLGLSMYLDSSVKEFFYITLSNYSSDEKIFRPWFWEDRIFGWSEELFFLAPVAVGILFSYLWPKSWEISYFPALVVITLFCLMNARIGFAGVTLGVLLRYSLMKSAMVSLFLLLVLALFFYNYSGDWMLAYINKIMVNVDILLESHIHIPLSLEGVVIGQHQYLFNNDLSPLRSDIGYFRKLYFGGAIYLITWLFFIGSIVFLSFNGIKNRLVFLLIFLIVGLKGDVFTFNSLFAVSLVFVYLKMKMKMKMKMKIESLNE
jgi:hypothetical protein